MSRKQTRRAVSMSRVTYEKLLAKAICDGCSMSSIVERAINEAIDRETKAAN